MKRCETKVKLSKDLLEHAKAGIKLDHEIGGNTELRDGELHRLEDSTGGFNKIILPRSLVDYHSHPSKCRADACALGIPSPADIKNVVVGTLNGSVNHLIFSKEGVYSVRLQDDILFTIKKSKCHATAYLDWIQKHYDSLHRKFVRTRMPYNQYVQQWLEHTNWLGFEVDFYPDGTTPEAVIKHDCGQDVESLPGAHETLDVMDSVEFQREARKKLVSKFANRLLMNSSSFVNCSSG
jgi:hypothetical protein